MLIRFSYKSRENGCLRDEQEEGEWHVEQKGHAARRDVSQ
jgi:hypothetical protein